MFAEDMLENNDQLLRKQACRLRFVLHQLNQGDVDLDFLKKNVEYVATLLECAQINESRKLIEDDQDFTEGASEMLPGEVREWLTASFTTNSLSQRKKSTFKAVANAVRTGIVFEKIFRRVSGVYGIPPPIPPLIAEHLKQCSSWEFDIFSFNDVTENQPLKFVGLELFNRYGLLSRFKILYESLEKFLLKMEEGYSLHKNPYHNIVHAADVTQTTHWMISQTGLLSPLPQVRGFDRQFSWWAGDLRSRYRSTSRPLRTAQPTAKLAIKPLTCSIVDLNIRNNDLKIDKTKALCLLVHCCDISHPAKPWDLHYKWTSQLLEEFFRQGDQELALGLPYSPMCDRHTTHVPESQIGFIDFIVEPSMLVCGEMLTKMVEPLVAMPPVLLDTTLNPNSTTFSRSPSPMRSSSSDEDVVSKLLPITSDGKLNIPQPWVTTLRENKLQWKTRAAEEGNRQKLDEEDAKENK